MKVERTYMKPGYSIPKYPSKPLGETVPCLLFVTSERINGGIKHTIKGKCNPLPFKECIVPTGSIGIPMDEWLVDKGWVEIGRNYS